MIKSLNLSVKEQVGQAMENFCKQRINPPPVQQFPMPDVSLMANSTAMWETRNFVPPPTGPYQKMYVTTQKQDVKQSVQNLSIAGRSCANFPRCAACKLAVL
jgi:hypothetical protein